MNEDEKPREHSFSERILELKHREPFEKFTLVMTSGSAFTIEHPDLLAMGESRMTYYFPKTDRAVEMRVNQISEIKLTGELVPG
jgi:hypothetical protein